MLKSSQGNFLMLVCYLGVAPLCFAAPGENQVEVMRDAMITSVECDPGQALETSPAGQQASQKIPAVRVGATGYGAPPAKYYPENQRRLMAMRASKIDAYRALAESINGLHIWGGTTIGDMVVQKDRYRVFLNSYVRGARVVSVIASEDGNYETVLDMMVDDSFIAKAITDPTRPPCSQHAAKITLVPSENPSTFYYSE